MSGLEDIVENMCLAVANGDTARLWPLAQVAGVKLGGERATRVKQAFNRPPAALNNLKHWQLVSEPRKPFVPAAVRGPVNAWLRELDNADKLALAGERVLPLLLSGETRCGKTSIAATIGNERKLPVYRLGLSNAVGSLLGESSKLIESAFAETRGRRAVWLIDEVDAIAFPRQSGQACEQERAHAVGAMLTLVESLPPGMALIATTNHKDNIDSAMQGRFTCVEWPGWSDLSDREQLEFIAAHGGKGVLKPDSYASAVKMAREQRVAGILGAEVSA